MSKLTSLLKREEMGKTVRRVLRLTSASARRMLAKDTFERGLAHEAHAFWTDPGKEQPRVRKFSHWRNQTHFRSDEEWLSYGAKHLAMLETAARAIQFPRPFRSVIEWGCGGGANAVHFVREAEVFYGVEVSQENLDECARQLTAVAFPGFRPVLIDSARPEEVLRAVSEPCDVFFSTWTFQHLPSNAYGLQVLALAHQLLRPGGLAMVHTRYPDRATKKIRDKVDYRLQMFHMTSYFIDELWEKAAAIGFQPLFVQLTPDVRCAYYFLQKAGGPTASPAVGF